LAGFGVVVPAAELDGGLLAAPVAWTVDVMHTVLVVVVVFGDDGATEGMALEEVVVVIFGDDGAA